MLWQPECFFEDKDVVINVTFFLYHITRVGGMIVCIHSCLPSFHFLCSKHTCHKIQGPVRPVPPVELCCLVWGKSAGRNQVGHQRLKWKVLKTTCKRDATKTIRCEIIQFFYVFLEMLSWDSKFPCAPLILKHRKHNFTGLLMIFIEPGVCFDPNNPGHRLPIHSTKFDFEAKC